MGDVERVLEKVNALDEGLQEACQTSLDLMLR